MHGKTDFRDGGGGGGRVFGGVVCAEGGTFDMNGRSVTLATFYMNAHLVT